MRWQVAVAIVSVVALGAAGFVVVSLQSSPEVGAAREIVPSEPDLPPSTEAEPAASVGVYGTVQGDVLDGVRVEGCGGQSEVDGDGGFFIEATPGKCRLRAWRGSAAGQPLSIDVIEGSDLRGLVLAAPSQDATQASRGSDDGMHHEARADLMQMMDRVEQGEQLKASELASVLKRVGDLDPEVRERMQRVLVEDRAIQPP